MIRRNYITSTPYVCPERKAWKIKNRMETSVDTGRLTWLTGGHWEHGAVDRIPEYAWG